MTEKQLQKINDAVDYPVVVTALPGGNIRLYWTDDPLDFITITPRQAFLLGRRIIALCDA